MYLSILYMYLHTVLYSTVDTVVYRYIISLYVHRYIDAQTDNLTDVQETIYTEKKKGYKLQLQIIYATTSRIESAIWCNSSK
jgi:hypothetical protein